MPEEEKKERGLRFECTQCGKCCWTRGQYSHVYLGSDDVKALADRLGLSTREFRARFTFRDENGWTELDFADGRCVLLDAETNLCTVYESRPVQCRTFPFWPELIRRGGWTAEARSICEGVGNGRVVPKQEVADRLAAQKKADES
ncbi:MAG TPA: YkgJ family cysteine cluster protein [Candidatus Binatia bacterium]